MLESLATHVERRFFERTALHWSKAAELSSSGYRMFPLQLLQCTGRAGVT